MKFFHLNLRYNTSFFQSEIVRIVLDRGKKYVIYIFKFFCTPFGPHETIPVRLSVQDIVFLSEILHNVLYHGKIYAVYIFTIFAPHLDPMKLFHLNLVLKTSLFYSEILHIV